MQDFSTLLQQGQAWLFIPTALLLGALHGLEPGHSKTVMAAFIVAIRGTVSQAALLGLSATLSHTAVVWVIALGGLYLGAQWDAHTSEPYFQLVSAALMVGVGLWMMWRNYQHAKSARAHHAHTYETHSHEAHTHETHTPEMHASAENALPEAATEYQDAHALAHAQDIRQRFQQRIGTVTTGQIITFGLTGGLIPCPASVTVLLLCLQLKKIALGVTLVLSFSLGLALTMVASGVLAALSIKHMAKHWGGWGKFAHYAPYLSAALMLLVGVYVGYLGLMAIFSPV